MNGWEAAEGISRTGTALVTGSAGFVGHHVTDQLKFHGWRVTGMDIGDDFPNHPVDVIVSLAATAEPYDAMRDPLGAYLNGVGVMVRTLEYARRHRSKVIHVSTNEANPPRGPYGGAKACQETVCRAYPDVPVTVVVTQSLFGEHQQPNKLIPTAIRAIINGEPVRLQRNANGYASRPFMHVRNLAHAVGDLAMTEWISHRRVNVGSSVNYRLDWVVQKLAEALHLEARIVDEPAGDRPGHEAHVELIGCDLYGRQLPYETMPALKDVARWYMANPEHLEPCAIRS